MQIIGIDVGTSGAKAAVFEPGRRMVACVREPYSCICPAKGLLELDPEEVWQAVVRCLKRLAGTLHRLGCSPFRHRGKRSSRWIGKASR